MPVRTGRSTAALTVRARALWEFLSGGVDGGGAGGAAVTPLDLDDPVFRQFVLAADPEEVEESGLQEITTPAFAVRELGLQVSIRLATPVASREH
jgi:hypothetical protein